MSPSPTSPTPAARRIKPIHKTRSFSFQMLTHTPDQAPIPQAMYSESLHPLRLPPSYDQPAAAPSYGGDAHSATAAAATKPNQYAVAAAAAAVQSASRQQQQQREANTWSAARRSESSLGFYRAAPNGGNGMHYAARSSTHLARRNGSIGSDGRMARPGDATAAARAVVPPPAPARHEAHGRRAVTVPFVQKRGQQAATAAAAQVVPTRSEFEFEFAETIPTDLASTIAVPRVVALADEEASRSSTTTAPAKRRRRLSFSWFSKS
ncbi:hypothetical protein BCR37DRAFT_386553 [Protomyces lactucae-debilis]|uniref:Uncharacterized protein n=1 Tax=Protomyces lactucae-debilis TaxID=2754530 RepID=A0A1Y2FNU6_PROLT|nr:uncharacterized protein BCR37DRAFT_386553 [Protomyces lactucae-debilis]ORY84385.1 hypothetical protein BCR37DRAFT_386553 [Protomyces lactucae-debilis]